MILWFKRAGEKIFQPVTHIVGRGIERYQFLGTYGEKCGCGKTHVVDAYVSFDTSTRGGWRPEIRLELDCCETHTRRMGESHDDDDLNEIFTAVNEVIKLGWWEIYNKGLDGEA